jgi:hypothetical protein
MVCNKALFWLFLVVIGIHILWCCMIGCFVLRYVYFLCDIFASYIYIYVYMYVYIYVCVAKMVFIIRY